MNGDAQGGTNMAKMILGIVLIAAGNLLAIKGYPDVPTVVLPANTAPLHPGTNMAEVANLSQLLPERFKMLMLSLLMLNVGTVFVYLSRDPKQD